MKIFQIKLPDEPTSLLRCNDFSREFTWTDTYAAADLPPATSNKGSLTPLLTASARIKPSPGRFGQHKSKASAFDLNGE
jgi:hypothetical protein